MVLKNGSLKEFKKGNEFILHIETINAISI